MGKKRKISVLYSVVCSFHIYRFLRHEAWLLDLSPLYPCDTFLKYVFEWTIALSYHLVSLMVGIEFFKRLNLSESVSFFLSLFVIVTLVGFVTETFNIYVYSWRVISMPFSNYMIGPYFLVFQTIGYWLMAIIPWLIYILIFKKGFRKAEVQN